jgi:hypothetical protein
MLLLRAIDGYGIGQTVSATARTEATIKEQAAKAALWDGLQHFQQNNRAIVSAAVAEAAAKGKAIDYPLQPTADAPTVEPATAGVPVEVYSELLNGRFRTYGAVAMEGTQIVKGHQDGPPL